MHWIPDVPKIIEDQIERENLITQRCIWQAKADIKSSKMRINTISRESLNYEQ